MGRATNKSVRFTASNVGWPGFWRNWGVWGDRSPRSFLGDLMPSERWTRRNVYATVIIGLLGCIVALIDLFWDSQDQGIDTPEVASGSSEPGKKTYRESLQGAEDRAPTILISSLHVSEMAMDIPAVFELGIQVGGRTNLPARDVNITLNFGRAEIEACDYAPKRSATSVISEDKSHRQIQIAELRQEEKFYVRCLINSPVFDQIIVTGSNITDGGRSIDFEQYYESLLLKPKGFWTVLGRSLVAGFFILLGFMWVKHILRD